MPDLAFGGIAGHVEELNAGDRAHRLVIEEGPQDTLVAGDLDQVRGLAELAVKGVKPEIGIRTVRTQQAAPRCATAANLRFDPFRAFRFRIPPAASRATCAGFAAGRW